MSDAFGGISMPVANTTTPGDPGLEKLGAFLQAVINANLDTAWRATSPAPSTTGDVIEVPVVKTVYLHDWQDFGFNDDALPALFVHRFEGATERTGDDWQADLTTFRVLWALSPLPPEEQRNRVQIINAVAKIVMHALEQGRDPAWVDATDPDVDAPAYAGDSDAIALSRASSTSPVSLSGAALDGVIGSATMNPRRGPTITTSATVGAWNTAAPVVWTVIDWFDRQKQISTFLTNPDGGESVWPLEDVKRVVQVDLPAMLSTAGFFELGVLGRAAGGSVLLERAGFDLFDRATYRFVQVQHVVQDGDQLATNRLPHVGVMMSIHMRESFVPDFSSLPSAKVDIAYTLDGFDVNDDSLT